eukprot:gene12161-biopygen2183
MAVPLPWAEVRWKVPGVGTEIKVNDMANYGVPSGEMDVLRGGVGPLYCGLRSDPAFCVQLRSAFSCVQNPAFSCVLRSPAFCVQDPAFCVQDPAFCVQLRSRSPAFCVQEPAFCVQDPAFAFGCVRVQLRSAFDCVLQT